MAIEFRVDAVLGNATQVQNLINQINRGATLTINNNQALQAIQQIQQRVDALRNSMANLNFGGIGNAGGGGGNGNGGTAPNYNIQANQGLQMTQNTAQQVQSIISNLNSQVDGVVSNVRLINDEQGNIIGGTARITEGTTTWTRNLEQVTDAQGNIIQGQLRISNSGQTIVRTQNRHNESLGEQLRIQLRQQAIYTVCHTMLQGIGEAISDCVNYTVDLDSAMTNIRVVTMGTKEEAKELLETYNKMGQKLGANTLDIAEGSIDWLRQGFSEADTEKLVEASTKLSKLALIDNAEATEYLTSALKGYKLEAQDAIGVIDQLVAIDLEAATSAGDMSEAMSRTANMARTTGIEMNELLGMIATMSEVTQNSASTIGNSVKTILSRMSNVKAGLDNFEGEALNDVEKTLNRVGIALRDNQGNWYDFYDVLDEVASKWDSFSDTQQSQITTALGGTRQRENILVALENWELVRKYAETGANSAGTANEKYGIIVEGVAAKQEQLNAKIQEFYMNILNSGLIAGLLDVGKAFMSIVNWGDSLIGKLLLLATVSTALAAAWNHLGNRGIHTFGALILRVLGLEAAELQAAFAGGVLNGVLTLLEAHPVIAGLSILIGVVILATTVFNKLNVTLEEQHEKAQKAQSDYEGVANELKAVNDELKTTKERIAELEAKDNLTFVEKEELKNLKETSAELESQAYWLEKVNKEKKKEVDKEASKAWDKDFNKNEKKSRYKYKTIEGERGGQSYSYNEYDTITEEEYIHEQIQYLGELEAEIQKVSNAEGEWANKTTEQRETELQRLRGLKTGVEQYLTDVGAKIQTDFLDAYDVSDEVKQEWLGLQEVIRMALDPDYTVKKFEEAVKNLPDTIKANFKNADNAGNFKTLEEAFTVGGKVDSAALEKFKKALKELNIEADDPTVLNYLNSLSKAANGATKAIEKMSYAAIFDSIKDKADALAEAEQEISKNGYLTAESVSNLNKEFANEIKALGGLDQYLTLTANGYKISKEGLDMLNTAVVSQYQTSLNEAKQGALNVLDQEHKKGLSYASTTAEIKKQLEAQLALAKANKEKVVADAAKEGYSRNEAISRSEKYSKQYKGYLDEEKAIQGAIDTLTNAQHNYDVAKQTLATHKTTSSNGSSSSKSAEEKALDKLKDQLDNNEITMDTYISELTKLLGTVKKGSDAWREINKELQKAKLDNVENQFDRGEITIDQYISKLEGLRKEYKKNTEGYKELTQTINEAKADKFVDQYERGEISLSAYIKQLTKLRNEYTKNSEEWKKYNDLINDTQIDKSLDDIQRGLDDIDSKMNQIGEVNTLKEQVKYAKLLSDKYKLVQSDISKIQKQLEQGNLTTEQRINLQEELNGLLEEEVSIRDEIEDSVREYYENQKEQAEKQAELTKKQTLYNKEVELYGKQGKELYEYYTNKEIEALEAKKEALDENNEREELENDLLEARLKLQNALNNKTTKILKKQADGTWQYEYSANMVDVKEAQDEVAEAEKALESYELQEQIDELNDNIENLAKQYEDAEFWADRQYEQTINGIEEAFGDIDSLVEDWMNKYGENTTAYNNLVESNGKLQTELADLTTAIESKYETVGSTTVNPTSFDTGGNIVGNGLAWVHDKERVLTAEQNAYFEQLVSKLPQLLKHIDVTKFDSYVNQINALKAAEGQSASTVISKVECVFPNITTTDGLQRAILELPRLALQKKK